MKELHRSLQIDAQEVRIIMYIHKVVSKRNLVLIMQHGRGKGKVYKWRNKEILSCTLDQEHEQRVM